LQEKDFTKDTKQLSYLNFSIEDKIKKSRDRLYFSYGAVLFALPLYIFSFAYYNTLLESLQYGINVPQNIAFWETFSTISFVGTSILGVNMGLQLIFYLNDANKVIPR
jgi:phospholipid N-methyltransferase